MPLVLSCEAHAEPSMPGQFHRHISRLVLLPAENAPSTSRLHCIPMCCKTLRVPSPMTGSPRLPEPPFRRAVPHYPGGLSGCVSIASPLTQPSPNGRRVGIRIVNLEACSGFTRATARRIAQQPKTAFVTRLQPFRLPGRAARQLPDQSTTLWVESFLR
jgi:hypothetical protein